MKKLSTVAWRNLKRKMSRTVLLSGSAAITAFILFASYFFVFSMERSIAASSSRLGADLMVVPKGFGGQAGDMIISGTPTKFYMPGTVLDKIRTIGEVDAASPQLYLQTVSTVCCQTSGDFPVVAYDPNTDFTLKNWMASDKKIGKYDLIAGANAGGKNYVYHFDNEYMQEWVTLFGKDFLLRNMIFPTGMGTDKTLFITMDAARELNDKKGNKLHFPKGNISIVLVKSKPGMEEFVKRQIDRMNLNVDIVKGSGLQDTVNKQVFPVKMMSYMMIGLVLIMSALQVMTMFSALISERRKEIGMLRAMGASRAVTFRLLLMEAGFASVIGAAIGSLLAAAALYDNRILILQLLQLPMLFPDWTTGMLIGAVTTVATTLIAIIAAFIPVRSALKLQPYEAIREGEY
ncbi:ABC transporter permease [Aneurinibacillus tyrosinisolvens]|uniref:ABC transporter permease n=1 Tax=Aneurinibacillus tyrosinisolvens TaxID=1443435 RepID=UPI000A82B946|nr:FtsX-like permease family protein [Aneurinibacillus tyrosinisolvens]